VPGLTSAAVAGSALVACVTSHLIRMVIRPSESWRTSRAKEVMSADSAGVPASSGTPSVSVTGAGGGPPLLPGGLLPALHALLPITAAMPEASRTLLLHGHGHGHGHLLYRSPGAAPGGTGQVTAAAGKAAGSPAVSRTT